MKTKLLLVVIATLILSNVQVKAQNIAINEDGSLANTSAIVDIKSTTKGLLIPRMTTIQRNAVAGVDGLLVYDTDTKSIWHHNGTTWRELSANTNAWLIGGNNNTAATDFLGTTNNIPLNFRVNNILSGRIDPTLNNTFWGYLSGNLTTSARFLTAIGMEALPVNTTGEYNTAIGRRALYSNTQGQFNTAVGVNALRNNTTESGNTGIGYSALGSSTGGKNTATGYRALAFNTDGSGNTATGYETLISNVNGINNSAMGYRAMWLNTSGSNNTAIGIQALYNNIGGNRNTVQGYQSLYNIKGDDNIGIGFLAGFDATNISGAIAIGSGTVINANNATAIGTGASATGINSMAVGRGAFVTADSAMAIGNLASATGKSGLAIGDHATIAADSATAIGTGASASGRNSMAIGNGATVTQDNKIQLGNGSVIAVESAGTFSTVSDGRYKYDVQEDVKGLDFILKLRPVTYRFDANLFNRTTSAEQQDNVWQASYKPAAVNRTTDKRRTGFIAQEVEKVALETHYDFSGINKPQSQTDHYSLSYESFVVPLVKAMQEQQLIIDKQANKLADQDKKIQNLEQQLNELKNIILANNRK